MGAFTSEVLCFVTVAGTGHLDLFSGPGSPVRGSSPAVCPVIGWAFDVQILQVGHQLVYNGRVLVHVKINILFLCSWVTGCYNTISICKECAGSKGVTADRVLLSLCFSIM